ncbi:hypothetical protein F0562_001482 [Nyssa sinensis]|uniref:Glucan endo-1,3-beta-D-glucosidase n=1 Tax=Nyssa sinensis TaxID=561372 RepID=A0A5J5C3D4_9ASTE|nr:hypothetical protein F0562_001482 [Nyssa sinensis]
MWIYDPNQATLQALRGSNIELILDVPNSNLQTLTSDASAATQWVQNNVRNYFPDVKFRYISVGNEVDPNSGTAQFVPFVLPAMQNIYKAIAAAGLQDQNQGINSNIFGTRGQGLEIVVLESGWPSEGGNAATMGNASTYYQNLINHVKGGTQRILEMP